MGLIMFKYDLFMTEQKEGETDSRKKNWIWPIPPLAADVSFKLRWYSSHMTGASVKHDTACATHTKTLIA